MINLCFFKENSNIFPYLIKQFNFEVFLMEYNIKKK